MKILLATLLLAYVCPLPSHAGQLLNKVQEYRLKNGLTLLMVERHSSPTFAASIRFKVGSANERSYERGTAHMLEHMLFKGTRQLGTSNYAAEQPLLEKIDQIAQRLDAAEIGDKKPATATTDALQKELAELEKQAGRYQVTNELFKLYAQNGGNGLNAFTNRDSTTYMVELPSNKLELWAAVESDRFKNPVLREFYTERSVVMEERRRAYDENPPAKLREQFYALAYQTHPYRQPTIGWPSDIRRLSRAKVASFLQSHYAPNNAVIALVGDIQPEQAIKLVERYFGDMPPKPLETAVVDQEEPPAGERRVELSAVGQRQLLVGFHKPAAQNRDSLVFDLIAGILTKGRTSRLQQNLALKRKLAAGISVFEGPGRRYPNLFIFQLTPLKSPANVIQALQNELERLQSEPVSTQELHRVINLLLHEELRAMATNYSLARALTEYEATAGGWRNQATYRSRLAQITAEDIQQTARRYFIQENRIIGMLTPVKAEVKPHE